MSVQEAHDLLRSYGHDPVWESSDFLRDRGESVDPAISSLKEVRAKFSCRRCGRHFAVPLVGNRIILWAGCAARVNFLGGSA